MDALRMWRSLFRRQQPVPRGALDVYRDAIRAGVEGRWDDAEGLLVRCLSELENAEMPQAAAANHNLSAILMARGDKDGGIFHCIRGLFLYNTARDVEGLYGTLRNLAIIHAARGELRMAEKARHEIGRARRELANRGTLQQAESGRDSHGEPLRLLQTPPPGSRAEAV